MCLFRLAAKPWLRTPSLPPLFSYVIPAGTLQLNCKPLPAHQPSSIADNPLQELFPVRKATFFYLEFLVYAQPLHSCFPPWAAPLLGRKHFHLLFISFYIQKAWCYLSFVFRFLIFIFLIYKIVCVKRNGCELKKKNSPLSLLIYCSANNSAVCENGHMIHPDISYVSLFCFVRIAVAEFLVTNFFFFFFFNLPCYDLSILNHLIWFDHLIWFKT